MRRSRRSADGVARARPVVSARARRIDDEGSASLEFLTVGLLLLVPTVYLVVALATVQSAAFAVEGAARQAARVYVQAADAGAAAAAAERAIDVTLADYGLDGGQAAVSVTCRPDPADCLRRHGFVTVAIEATVPLPLLPPALEVDLPLGVPLGAVATEQVSRFRGGS